MKHQLSFADIEMNASRKPSRISIKLDKINQIVDWDKVLEIVKVVDYTSKETGGSPHKDLLVKIKMVYLQHLYNFSDPELEDQVNDRLSFQQFIGLNFTTTVPDYSTIWRFKDRLIKENLTDKLFEIITSSLDKKGLIVKKGTVVDATIIQSANRPLSKERRGKYEKTPNSQIDTDAHSTQKRGKKYFGYKGHIGVDIESKLIRKVTFTPANTHDSKEKHKLFSGDEKALFGDNAYSKIQEKQLARKLGIYYGMQEKKTRGKQLTASQKKKNKKHSKIRSQVEHPFGFIKCRLDYRKTVAKSLARNELRFKFNCMIYNIFRGAFLLS
ncbi:MAG: IS5 family transposase [Flavobacteriaceae bacterium]|nr:IS5 family transposase [Flavobacteriaceae bacterium]